MTDQCIGRFDAAIPTTIRKGWYACLRTISPREEKLFIHLRHCPLFYPVFLAKGHVYEPLVVSVANDLICESSSRLVVRAVRILRIHNNPLSQCTFLPGPREFKSKMGTPSIHTASWTPASPAPLFTVFLISAAAVASLNLLPAP